ncbi:MAG: nucleoside-diphosphate kinase [Betaproteobacteria bacterium AqS2]|uniref:Nucleoside diphosphate kinase n=1 Tax=Candidatus Amphirhobacter heronislandensis TaxID=1732024 RepID=A0A930XYC5_9GAMM|nr:nucleoside-diphosphate kinase [Betaproteobacteria bacterium AqS2]
MPAQKTLSIIKPDAVASRVIGQIIARFEQNGLELLRAELRSIDRDTAKAFYAEHAEKPFFGELIDYITSGPAVVAVVAGEDAVALHRKLMGATNPKDAEPGTIRADFAKSLTENAIHGSDSVESAKREIAIFFPAAAKEEGFLDF